ncbi:TonB-dependent receptor [Catenovulum sp. SX2]|uniref:TonB-dependent receptor n=1 Tax=Catenovulum sp. SX2 TaxID=3398614 RepID=UPI003F87338B
MANPKYYVLLFGLFTCGCAHSIEAVVSQQKQQVHYFNIARTDAANALNQLAQQANVVLVYSYEMAEKVESNALHGYFAVKDALNYLLRDTGLAVVEKDGQIVILAEPIQVVNTSAQAITKPAEQIQSSTEFVQAVEVIKVGGLRASLYRAQDIKRSSNTIIEAIASEEIGKLADITSADTVSHLAGIQVERYNDEVNRILVRGLPNFTTTYNGREFFTAELRTARLQDFSSQSISEIEVHKAASADIIEPGLTGVVNIRTHKPLDFSGEKITGALSATYNDQIDTVSPSGHLLYSNSWQTQYGRFGFLGNISQSTAEYYNGVKYNATSFSQIDGQGIIPNSVGLYNNGGYRKRPSVNVSLQWQPNETTEFYFDSIYQGFDSEKYVDHLMYNLAAIDATFSEPIFSEIEFDANNSQQAVSLHKQAGRPPYAYRSTSRGKTDTYQHAVGASWRANKLVIKTDLAYTDSEYSDQHWSLDSAFAQPASADVRFATQQGASIYLTGIDASNVNNYQLRGYFELDFNAKSQAVQWRLDAEYSTNFDFIHTLQSGFRITDRDMSIERGTRYAYLLDLHRSLSDVSFVGFTLTPNPYRHDNSSFSQYIAPTRQSIQANHLELAEYAHDGLIALSQQGEQWQWAESAAENWQSPDVLPNPVNWLEGREQTQALYLQAKTYNQISSMNLDGIFGIRLVNTRLDISGNSVITDNGETSITARNERNSYLNLLPSINLNLSITDELLLRLAYSKSLTRSDFVQYNPGNELNVQISDDAVKSYNGSGGNSKLKPGLSDNYDMSLEYYFSDKGYIAAALFKRNLYDMPVSSTSAVDDYAYGPITISRPENIGSSKLVGGEINVQSFFDWLDKPFNGFGVSANLTYQDGQTDRVPIGNFKNDYIWALSNWTYNLAVLYDYADVSARVSYNYRSGWTNWASYQQDIDAVLVNKTESRGRLDLAVSYNFSDRLSIFSHVSNLLAEPLRNFTSVGDNIKFPQDVRDEGRYLTLGMRMEY